MSDVNSQDERGSQDEVVLESPDGKYRVRFQMGEDHVVHAEAFGYEDFDSSKEVVEILRGYYSRTGKKLRLCLDATQHAGLAPESRTYMREALLAHDSFVCKFSVVGGNMVTRNIFNMYSKIANIPMKVFKTREQALAWLAED